VILLDDYHVRRGNDMGVRKPLIDFIQNQLSPLDLVASVPADARDGAQLHAQPAKPD
jgi:hypothetical protein